MKKDLKIELKKEETILETISDIYIFALIIIYPLIVNKTGFFHILECKWYAYLIISCTYIGINILVLLYYLIKKKVNFFKDKKFTLIQWLAVAFLGINIISCFASPFFNNYNLFIGVGRGEGLIMTSLYIITYLCITLFAKFKRKHILYFSISSILLNIIAVLQYIGFNPLNMYQNGIGTHNVSFMTTIGNIDFISALYCILIGVSFSAYVFLEDNKKHEKIIHLISIFLGLFILGIIDVQSGKVAFLGTLIIILPIIISNNKRLSRFITFIATFLMSYCVNIIINPEYHYDLQKLKLNIQFNYIAIMFIAVCAILLYLSKILNKNSFNLSTRKNYYKNIYLGIFFTCILGIGFLYFYNFQSGILYEMHELLHGNFSDEFGTYRIFLWKRTLKIFPEYPLIGSGPDTFAIRFMAKYTKNVASIGPLTINDTAANVYLTMLINIGITGLLIYLINIFLIIKEGLKKINKYSLILLIAIICFLIQDFFNLWLVIVTPIFWLLLGLEYCSINNRPEYFIDKKSRKKI